jgi:hypothetical protein
MKILSCTGSSVVAYRIQRPLIYIFLNEYDASKSSYRYLTVL